MTEYLGRVVAKIVIGAKTVLIRVLPSGKVVTDEYERQPDKPP